MENIQTLNQFLNGNVKTIENVRAYVQYLKDNNSLPTISNKDK